MKLCQKNILNLFVVFLLLVCAGSCTNCNGDANDHHHEMMEEEGHMHDEDTMEEHHMDESDDPMHTKDTTKHHHMETDSTHQPMEH